MSYSKDKPYLPEIKRKRTPLFNEDLEGIPSTEENQVKHNPQKNPYEGFQFISHIDEIRVTENSEFTFNGDQDAKTPSKEMKKVHFSAASDSQID